MIFYLIWRSILAGFLLKRVRCDGSINTAADFLPLRLLAGSLETLLFLPPRELVCWQLQPKGSDSEMPSREPAGQGCRSTVCFVPLGMCGLSKWQHWASPVLSWAPGPRSSFVLALFRAWVISLVETSFSTRGGKKAGGREKNMPFSWPLFQ